MTDFDTRTRQEPDEPNGPRSPSMVGRARNLLIAILRLSPIASYALAHVIVVGFWAYMVSENGVDQHLEHTQPYLGLLGAFLITAILIGPFGAILGEVDAESRRSSRPLLRALDALLIVLFALVWIVPVEWALLSFLSIKDNSQYGFVTDIPGWPTYIGVLSGAELGLVVLMVVSVTGQLIVRRSRRGAS